MRTKFIIAGFLACIATMVQAQEIESKKTQGKAIIQVFGNFHAGFGSENENRGFELDRSYLGYQYSIGKSLEIKAVMDVGKSSDVGDLQRIAYIKNAQIKWESGDFTLHGGLISTTSFKVQEDFWGYRYMKMVLQDYYKFARPLWAGIGKSQPQKMT